jgi:hypothetical protein
MIDLNAIKEEVGLYVLETANLSLALTEASNSPFIKDNPVFGRVGDKVLFGYRHAPGGIVMTPVTMEEAVKLRLTEAESIQPDPVEDDSCEILEVTPEQWEKLAGHQNYPLTKDDEDTQWLAKAGVVSVTPGGNVAITSLGKQWLKMG